MKWLKEHTSETAYRAVRTCIQVAAGVIAAGLVSAVSSGTTEEIKALIVCAVATGIAAAMNIVSKEE